MCCLSWLSALFGQLGWHSSNAAQPLSQELQDRAFTSTYHGYQTLQSMPQLPAVKRDSISSVEAPASKFQAPSLSSEYPEITAQALESMPQVPAATVKRDGIGSVEVPASTSSTLSLSSDHPKITVRSIKYLEKKLQSAEIAYSIDQRRSWHWLPYKRLVEKWGEDDIREFTPTFSDGL